MMPFPDSRYADTTPPEGGYNVTNPQANSPISRASMFSKRMKPLDMQGRVIDLDKMPDDATVIRNDRTGPQFDDQTPGADRAAIRLDMYNKANDEDNLDASTGMGKRAPLKGYNHDTGEYFTMAQSGPKVTSARAQEWARRIEEGNANAAAIAEKKAASMRADKELTSRDVQNEREMKLKEKQIDGALKLAEGSASTAAAESASRIAERTATVDMAKKAQEQGLEESKIKAVASLPEQLQKGAYEKLGINIDANVQRRQDEIRGIEQAKEDIDKYVPIQGLVDRLSAEVASGNLNKWTGSIKSNPELGRIKAELSSLARQMSASGKISYEQARALLQTQVTSAMSPTVTRGYNDIIAALADDAVVAPARYAPKFFGDNGVSPAPDADNGRPF